MSGENETGARGSGGEAPGDKNRRPPFPGYERSEPAAIALRMEDLPVWVIERTAKMPREHKFTVGDKLVERCLEITTLLVEASFAREKLPLLAAASRAASQEMRRYEEST